MGNYLTTLVEKQALKYGDREAYSFREEGESRNEMTTWNGFKIKVDRIARGFAALGISEAEHIGVFSANRPHNIIFDFAAYSNRAIPVSIYSTSSADQVKYIVNDADIKILGVGSQTQYDVARKIINECPTLERLVTFAKVKIDEDDKTTLTFEQLSAMGESASEQVVAEVEKRRKEARPDDVATLIYTSGTTGEPKGAILPHLCFDAIIDMHLVRLDYLTDEDTVVSFLPLSHIFEKAWNYLCFYMGMRVFVNVDPRVIQDTLRRERPTCMCSVPRFWEKVYAGIQDKLSRVSGFKRMLMRRAISVGRRRNIDYVRLGKRVPKLLEMRYQFYYNQIFGPTQKVVGVDRGVLFPTAGAPLSNTITEYLISMGIPIVIGYGLSETTATVSCFTHTNYTIGTVGLPLEGLEVKIGADNEVMVKGPTIMRGYHNKPEATANALTQDGWLLTGDAGYLTEKGEIVLTERIKDLFKTSNGKYIAPQVLESRLGEDPMIEQVAVIGDQRKFVSALIVPSYGLLEDYAKENGIAYSNREELVANDRIHEMMERRIDACQQGLAGYERIKRFTLLPHEFTMESGELTNTLKLRRPVVNEHYAREIAAMYAV